MALNFPINPTVGQVYTVGNESWQWDGHCWGVAADTATYAPVSISQFPPASPIAGDLWWNSTSGTLCIYYADVDGSQWVSATQVPDIIATVSSAQVVTGFLEELTPYVNTAAAVAGGVPTGGLFKVTGGTTVSAIRAVASYGGSGSGDKGQKGEAGTNGTNGTKGQKGQDGTGGAAGTKGQKGQDGTGGAAGTKGQKGEVGVGTKGQKGEVGVGTKGQKGQDGTAGSNGSNGSDGTNGAKGQKGQEGAAATKGQKGEVGTGTKGQKGQDGTAGSNGTNGTKGQKGQEGAASTKGQKGQDGAGGGAGAKGQKGQEGAGTPVGSTNEIQFNNNGAFGSNANLTFNPSLNVLQTLSATIVSLGAGQLSVSGNTTLGDANTDTINVVGSVDSNILPLTNNQRNLGSTSLKWNNIYGNVLHGTALTLSGDVTMSLSDYANDTAAAAGGIGIGQFYRNGSVVQIRVS